MHNHDRHPAKVLLLENDMSKTHYFESILDQEMLEIVEHVDRLVQKAAVLSPDLIIIDASGQALADALGLLRNTIELEWVPIIALTQGLEDSISALELGAIDFFPENLHPKLMRLKIQNFLRCKQIHDAVKDAESEIRRKLEELESLIQMVVHDLKSPVVAMHGFIRLLERVCANMPPDPRRDEILDHLYNSSKTIQDFLKDLSNLLTAEEIHLDLSQVSLDMVAQSVMRQHQQALEEKRIKTKVDVGNCRPLVVGDERRIVQVLDNLVSNAINYMGDLPEGRIEIQFRETNDCVITSVSDNGIGIPPEYQSKIFNRFFRVPGTARKPGTGLGLSIVKAIVESHGGKIWVESRYGQGTTFNFTLPKDQPLCSNLSSDPDRFCRPLT